MEGYIIVSIVRYVQVAALLDIPLLGAFRVTFLLASWADRRVVFIILDMAVHATHKSADK